MPFNLAGDYIPPKKLPNAQAKPVKVRLVKRGKSILTVILHLNMNQKELSELSSSIKKKLGCGGSVKEDTVEIQGDKVEEVITYLKEIGIKAS